eukprot:INCI9809.1.p1 GENE.INCI9809.1~~INCI9809.1.p1  ORF type:complete len:498 (-),score=102.43 INCI9809.1:160-1653(-)
MSIRQFMGRALSDVKPRIEREGRKRYVPAASRRRGSASASSSASLKKKGHRVVNLRETIEARRAGKVPSETTTAAATLVLQVPIEENDDEEGADSEGQSSEAGVEGMWAHDKYDPQVFPPQKPKKGEDDDDDDDGDGDTKAEESEDEAAAAVPQVPTVVLVNNLGPDITDDEIRQLFEQFGEVLEAKVYPDLGVARVKYPSLEVAEESVAAYDGRLLDQKRLEVTIDREAAAKAAAAAEKREAEQKKKESKKRKAATSVYDGVPVKVKVSSGGVKMKIKLDDEASLAKAKPRGNRKIRVVKNGAKRSSNNEDNSTASKPFARRIIRIDIDEDGRPTDTDGRWRKNPEVAERRSSGDADRGPRTASDGRQQRGRGQMKFGGSMHADHVSSSVRRRSEREARERGDSMSGHDDWRGDRENRDQGSQPRGKRGGRGRDRDGRGRGRGRDGNSRDSKHGDASGSKNRARPAKREKASVSAPAKAPADLDAELKAFLSKKKE